MESVWNFQRAQGVLITSRLKKKTEWIEQEQIETEKKFDESNQKYLDLLQTDVKAKKIHNIIAKKLQQ